MKEITGLFDSFARAAGCQVELWSAGAADVEPRLELRSSAQGELTSSVIGASVAELPGAEDPPAVVGAEKRFVAPVAGERLLWVAVHKRGTTELNLAESARFLADMVAAIFACSSEVEQAASELAERYEEINLLYTISEILGRTVSMQDATAIILNEISSTVGASKGAILVLDRVTDTLQAVAALGVSPIDTMPIARNDGSSVSARVFEARRPMLVERGAHLCHAEESYREGAMLSVPIIWTSQDGGEPLGVINLSGRTAGHPFTAGDQKLVAAIASQIASAIQNARLVRNSLSQQRLLHEMELAHDLQMHLLPDGRNVSDATVAARVVPAESVGGDFYNLFPLPGGRTGALVGDVSGHGYRAALIMALTMSASAIHAQTTSDPGETLNALRASLKEELLTTEMYISAFYGVTDPAAGVLRFANTGHPHAFVFRGNGDVSRLAALDPPLGMSDAFPSVSTVPWARNEDLLVVFTDGVVDARNLGGERLGESTILDLIAEHRSDDPERILEIVFAAIRAHTEDATRRDDLTLLVLRS